MKFISRKLVYVFLLTTATLLYAQPPGIPDPGDGGGGVGPGAPASPIDMYVYILVAVGILMMAYYVKKMKTNKV